MEIYLHTIALEPARWRPARVSRPLAELLPEIARRGFRKLEIYEPHLALATDEAALVRLMGVLRLDPVILSSYAALGADKTDDVAFASLAKAMAERVERFGFQKVRLFPGQGIAPGDDAAVAIVQQRIATLARQMPDAEFLLETHDHSIADDPACIVRMVKAIRLLGQPNVSLLFQPTLFEAESTRKQLALQKPWVRHIHLQNRWADLSLSTLREGVVPWGEFLPGLAAGGANASIEFVPSGMVPPEAFDLEQTLDEVAAEVAYVQTLVS